MVSTESEAGQHSGKTNSSEYVFEQFRVERGCLGYIVADSESRKSAFVDPAVEMAEPMLDFILEHGLKPLYVIETHTHADHFSGASELKRKTCAKLVMHEKATCSRVDIRVEDGDRLKLGSLVMKFLHTPGHAKDLVCIELPGRILTADALLVGSCGRTDLPNGNSVQQYHTLYHTLRSLSDDLLVYPGHDYEGRSHSVLGVEKSENSKMRFETEEEFTHYMDHENPRKLDPVYQLSNALKANME